MFVPELAHDTRGALDEAHRRCVTEHEGVPPSLRTQSLFGKCVVLSSPLHSLRDGFAVNVLCLSWGSEVERSIPNQSVMLFLPDLILAGVSELRHKAPHQSKSNASSIDFLFHCTNIEAGNTHECGLPRH